MTNWEFHQLKIGDFVYNETLTEKVQITEIHKTRGLLMTEGIWRDYKKVRLPIKGGWPDYFTMVPTNNELKFSARMLQKLTLMECFLTLSIQAFGEKGFVGNYESLCKIIPIFKGPYQLAQVIGNLKKKGVFIRKDMPGRSFHLMINEERIKDYL